LWDITKNIKGIPVYKPLQYFVGEVSYQLKLMPGNENVPSHLSEELATARYRLGTIDACRLDAGYASEEHLRELDQFKKTPNSYESVDFYLGVGGNCLGLMRLNQGGKP